MEVSYKVFISYAQTDKEYKDEFLLHLKSLERIGVIKVWLDDMIEMGKDWNEQIMRELESSEVILLFISPSFIASEFIWQIELKRAMEKFEREESLVLPIIVRPCYWERLPFSKIQALPTKGKPIALFENRDVAYAEITKELIKLIENFQLKKSMGS